MFATSRLGPRVRRPPDRPRREGRDMLGQLYDRALGGERCWIRHDDGELRPLPAHRWLGVRCPPDGSGGSGDAVDEVFDEAVTQMCTGPTIELGCGPGRLVARLIQRGIPALGIDRSATAIQLAGRGGAPALLGDVFEELPGTGLWQTVLLVDGNVGLGGDPLRILARRLEADPARSDADGLGFEFGDATAAALAAQVGLTLTGVRLIGDRVIASLAAV